MKKLALAISALLVSGGVSAAAGDDNNSNVNIEYSSGNTVDITQMSYGDDSGTD
jgi:hypothetical protein